MQIQAQKKMKFLLQLSLWKLLLLLLLVLSACGDLVSESDTGACNNALDARNYTKALSVCTSRKDKASAYMGIAGYDIVNLLKSSGTSTTAYTAPSGVSLGTDDVSGASILNILQLSVAKIADAATRATAITNSKTNLDSASALLHPYLSDNSSPLSTDEIFLDTFAIAFAMQLNQLIVYDNATTSTSSAPSGSAGGLTCPAVSGADGSEAQVMLIAMDGHLWSSERDGMQCTRMKNAIDALSESDQAAVLIELSTWASAGGLLPSAIRTAVCDPLASLTSYLTKLGESTAKLTLSGDNTKAITNAQTSTNTLLKTVGCKE
ncbi:MAG: hypothetical protein H8E38_10470 [SAR324 cluster bacterium]|nr:hypothetical protein [SAR324 cluster bacterium]MBL7035582.1 hypothetical protein [SAR324 cluster bacterium]